MRNQRTIAIGAVAALLFTALAHAHEEGAPFSGSILDPIILHHVHIENEQRLNFFALNGVPDASGIKHTGYVSEFELAYGSPNYKYGFELFLPIENMASRMAEAASPGCVTWKSARSNMHS